MNIVDGLGRLRRLDEPNSSNSLGGITSPAQATTYTYDAFSSLTQVAQGAQTRTFNYSSLSRLTSAVNPESGTTSYTYDNNGNLMTKTDGRGVVKTFDPYDALNRVKRWTYTGGPPEARSTSEVTYSYDACGNNSKGRLCSVTSKDSAGAVFSTTSYSAYDPLGRAGQSSQTTNGQALPYTLSYTYNPAGLTSQTYPSGLVVKTGYDGAGRVAGVSNSDGSLYYVGAVETDAVNRMQYAAHGGLQQMKVANGLWEESRFNARLQALQIGLGRTQTALGSSLTQTNSDYLLLDYTYSSTQNNGNMLNQRIRVAAATPAPALDLTQSYSTYDSLNRLKTASETAGTGTAWAAITYDFDRFGNRAVTAGYKPVPGQTPQLLTEFNTATNRMVSPSVYDGAGNQTTDKAGCTTKYDGENKMVEYNCGLGVTTYAYDGDGRRVKKVSGGLTTIYVYNLSGQLIAEYSSQGPTGTGISYLTRDHLGSTRVVTDANRSVKARHDYLPYGEEIEVAYGGRGSIPGYGAIEGTRQRFTAKERDIESGLDYFGARYFSGARGRFSSVDAKRFNSKFLLNPQKWNKYAYVLNNPLALVDPDGQEEITVTYSTFIPAKAFTYLGKIYAGDARGFSTAATASSRSSITVRIETDPSKRPGNPIISQTSSAGTTKQLDANGNVIKSATATQGLPVATGTRDANGNAMVNIQQDTKNPLSPVWQFLTPGISANLTVAVPQDASSAHVTGTASVFPAQELNVTREDGNTTPVIQFQPAPDATPTSLFMPDRTVDVQKEIPPCHRDDKGNTVCSQ